jgi:hypothetical protein
MSMKWVRDYYGVPAKRGMRIEAYYPQRDGSWRLAYEGKISSASNYIHVDGIPFHPTWNIVYYDDDGNILKDTRETDG